MGGGGGWGGVCPSPVSLGLKYGGNSILSVAKLCVWSGRRFSVLIFFHPLIKLWQIIQIKHDMKRNRKQYFAAKFLGFAFAVSLLPVKFDLVACNIRRSRAVQRDFSFSH